jgi:hypothetical protein
MGRVTRRTRLSERSLEFRANGRLFGNSPPSDDPSLRVLEVSENGIFGKCALLVEVDVLRRGDWLSCDHRSSCAVLCGKCLPNCDLSIAHTLSVSSACSQHVLSREAEKEHKDRHHGRGRPAYPTAARRATQPWLTKLPKTRTHWHNWIGSGYPAIWKLGIVSVAGTFLGCLGD